MTLTKKLICIAGALITAVLGVAAGFLTRSKTDGAITIATFEGNEILDYPILKQAEERIGITFKIITVPEESWSTKIRLMVAGDTLPDIVAWYDVNFGEYYQFAKAGVMKELPDFSPYPNVMKAWEEKSEYIDDLKVDGKHYLWPKNYMSNPFNDFSERIFAYRVDWAKQLGSLFGDETKDYYDPGKAEFYSAFSRVQEIGWDEFWQMLRDFKQLCGEFTSESAIPYLPDSQDDFMQLVVAFEKQFDGYIETQDGYRWGAESPDTFAAVEFLNARYKEGLIYRDLATMTDWTGNSHFVGGNAFVLGSNGTLGYLTDLQNRLKANTGVDPTEAFGTLIIRNPDGKLFDYKQADYWGAMFINADISDEKLEKWLQFMDFIYDEEIIRQFAYGVEGTDYTMKGNSVVLNWPKRSNGQYYLTNEKMYISGQNDILRWFELEGRVFWMANNPLYAAADKRLYTEIMDAKTNVAERYGTQLHETDKKVEYSTGPQYVKYGAFSKEVADTMILATVSENASQSLNTFIASMKARVNPVIEELNGRLG